MLLELLDPPTALGSTPGNNTGSNLSIVCKVKSRPIGFKVVLGFLVVDFLIVVVIFFLVVVDNLFFVVEDLFVVAEFFFVVA